MNLKHSLVVGAAALALASPALASDMTDLSGAERDAFRAEVRAYLLDNPEVLMEAIKVLEDRQAADQAAGDINLVNAHADAIFNDGHSYIGGNPDGDITVVEFLDYRCGYCKRAHPEVTELVTSDGNIRYIIKEFPILGEQSVLAARFAIGVKEAEGSEAYAEVHDELMTYRGNFTEQSLSDLSEAMGFNTKAVFDAMNSPATQAIISENRQLAQALSINGTPSFVFETQMLRGYVPLDGMQQVVAELRAE